MKNNKSILLVRIGFSIEIILLVIVGYLNKLYNFSYDENLENELFNLIIGWYLVLLIPKLIIGGLITDSVTKKNKPSFIFLVYIVFTIFPYLNLTSGCLYIYSMVKNRTINIEDENSE